MALVWILEKLLHAYSTTDLAIAAAAAIGLPVVAIAVGSIFGAMKRACVTVAELPIPLAWRRAIIHAGIEQIAHARQFSPARLREILERDTQLHPEQIQEVLAAILAAGSPGADDFARMQELLEDPDQRPYLWDM